MTRDTLVFDFPTTTKSAENARNHNCKRPPRVSHARVKRTSGAPAPRLLTELAAEQELILEKEPQSAELKETNGKTNSKMFSTMIATAMEVVAALVETKAMKTDAAAAAAPTPAPAPSAEVVLCEKGDGECLIAVAFGPLAIEETTQDEEDECLVVEAFGPLAAEEAAQDEDDDSSATTAGKLIVEAFDTFVDAPAPAAGPSLSARLMEVALALVKQYVTDCAIAVAVPMAKWAAWYAVLWVKEYAKLTLELEMKREAAAERMKKTAHRAVRQW